MLILLLSLIIVVPLLAQKPDPYHYPIRVPQLERAPTIDGDLSDWKRDAFSDGVWDIARLAHSLWYDPKINRLTDHGNEIAPEEDLAAHFLRLLEFTVLSRNSRRHGPEVDLLSAQGEGGDIFIFEVKRRAGADPKFFPAVSARQKSRLKKVALKMQQDANKFLTIRICLLLVDLRRGSVELVLDID